jgi:pyrimidine-specific ribonucleoside hydrolase
MRNLPFLRRRLMAFAVVATLLFPVLPAPRAAAASAPPTPVRTPAAGPVIVDTDAGIDDLVALAFLLGRRDVHIEAITVVNGLCHVPDGVNNILRLLQLAGRPEIPVYAGSTAPLAGNAAFPAAWRKDTDALPGVTLPALAEKPQTESATSFLTRRLGDARRPVRILALGPLTNIGSVLRVESWAVQAIQEIVIMGGALNVAGNLGDGGYFITSNTTAEWNFYMDPLAASIVFSSGAPIRLIPLDATIQVPIKIELLDTLTTNGKTPLEKFAAEILATQKKSIAEGIYFAWDPLAAVALANSNVVSTTAMSISITEYGAETGRSVAVPLKPPNAQVAMTANAALFRRDFLEALATPPPAPPAAVQPKTPAPTPPAATPKTATPAPKPTATPTPPAGTATPPASTQTPKH